MTLDNIFQVHGKRADHPILFVNQGSPAVNRDLQSQLFNNHSQQTMDLLFRILTNLKIDLNNAAAFVLDQQR